MKAPFQVIALVTLGSLTLAAAAPADASQVRRSGAVGQGPDPRGVAAQDGSEQRGDPSALRLKTIRLPDGRVLIPAPTSVAPAD